MKINPKTGIDKLIFGMLQKDVEAIYGKPNKSFKDEDENTVYQYNEQKLRLTFYKDEDFKLGYVVGSSEDLLLFDKKVIARKVSDVQKELNTKDFAKWDKEEFDTLENYFNEANWMIFQTEFDHIVKVEVGAIINAKDEFDWKFKK